MSAEATPRALLESWLLRQLDAPAADWLRGRLDHLSRPQADRDLYLAVSLVTRKLGKADLDLSEADLAAAEAARSGWSPVGWSVDQAARVLLVLAAEADDDLFAKRLEQLFITADVGELVAFYRGLPLYRTPERWRARAAEGARTNMKAVFEAVAHRNPYPQEQFDEVAWNHMVLKALFVSSTLWPVVGLEARQNPELTRMLCDYAHERWAASRSISVELWRCTSRCATDTTLADLDRVLASDDPLEQQAGALALAASPHPEAAERLAAKPDLAQAINNGSLTWTSLVSAAGLT